MQIDAKKIEEILAKDLAVVMERETERAFRIKAWDGQAWPERQHDYGIGSLMVRSGSLRRGLMFNVAGNEVVVSSSMPYAAIHNSGGVMSVPITKRSRGYFWAMWYKTKDPMWRAMALTKKKSMVVRLPPRPFVGVTRDTEAEFNKVVQHRLRQFDVIGAVKAYIK